MDFRYLTAGTLIIATSAAFIAYSLVSDVELVLGVSLSTLVVGVVVLATGLTFSEPVGELLKQYVKDLSKLATKVLEDAGLIGSHRVRACSNDLKVVISVKPIKCSEAVLGFGLANEVPYVAMPVDLSRFDVGEVGSDLRDYLGELLVRRFKVCRSVKVVGDGDGYLVELSSVNDVLYDLIRSPLNYLKFLILALTAKYLRRDVELVDEEFVGSDYVIRFKVVK